MSVRMMAGSSSLTWPSLSGLWGWVRLLTCCVLRNQCAQVKFPHYTHTHSQGGLLHGSGQHWHGITLYRTKTKFCSITHPYFRACEGVGWSRAEVSLKPSIVMSLHLTKIMPLCTIEWNIITHNSTFRMELPPDATQCRWYGTEINGLVCKIIIFIVISALFWKKQRFTFGTNSQSLKGVRNMLYCRTKSLDGPTFP